MAITNPDDYDALCKLLSSDPKQCVILFGSGLTKNCMEPWGGSKETDPSTWDGLLLNGIGFCEANGIEIEADELRLRMTTPGEGNEEERDRQEMETKLAVAQIFWDALDRSGKTQEWLDASIGELKPSKAGESVLRAIALLQRTGVSIATTNYDDFLTRISGSKAALPGTPEISQVLAGTNANFIAHIHGSAIDASKIILTKSQYGELGSNSSASFGQPASIIHRHWIFIGCGATLKDDNWSKSLGLVSKYIGQYTRQHYFCRKIDDSGLAVLPDQRDHLNIKLIEYSEYPDLGSLITGLAHAAKIEPFERFEPDARSILQHLSPAVLAPDVKPTWAEFENNIIPKPSNFEDLKIALKNDRYLYIIANAGTGKTVLGLQFAALAKAEGRPVYWLNAIEGMNDFQAELKILAHDNALIIIDEAHTQHNALITIDKTHRQPNLVRDIINDIILSQKNCEIIFLHTEGYGENTLNKTTKKNYLLSNDIATYKSIYRYITYKHGGYIDISDDRIDKWRDIFKNNILIFSISLIQFVQKERDLYKSDLSKDDAQSWLSTKYEMVDAPIAEKINLAFLGLIGSTKDKDMGWVPAFALPYSSAPFTEKRQSLVLRQQRPGFEDKLFRLSQANVLGDLVCNSYKAEAAGDRADQHFKNQPSVLAARIMIRPEYADKIIQSVNGDFGLLKQSIEAYLSQFALRLNAVALPSLATLFGYINTLGNQSDEAKSLSQKLADAVTQNWTLETLTARDTLNGAGSLSYWLFKLGQLGDGSSSSYKKYTDMLRTAVVQRCDPSRDFTNPSFNIHNLQYLLRNITLDHGDIKKFIENIWEERWLKYNMKLAAMEGHFQDAIFQSVLYASNEVYLHIKMQKFHYIYLSMIKKSLDRLANTKPPNDKEFFILMQNIGSAALLGVDFDEISSRIASLKWTSFQSQIAVKPEEGRGVWRHDEKPVDGSEPRIGNFQYKAWVGLRACCELLDGYIWLPKEAIEKRIKLWEQRRERFPDLNGLTRSGVISDSMIKWLKGNISKSGYGIDCKIAINGERLVDLDLTKHGPSVPR